MTAMPKKKPVAPAPKLPRTALTTGLAIVAALILMLTGCGGGDDATGAQPAAPTGGAATATCGLANFEAELLQRVNARRAAGATCGARGSFAPSADLVWNSALTQAATAHSQDMAAQNYFSHTSLDGRTLDQRVTATGYHWRALAENIAAGYRTIQVVVDGWMASDGHCANIMNPNLRDIGVACAPGTATNAYSNYWTMDLGAP